MTAPQRLEISLDPATADFVETAVASGIYGSREAVITDALLLLQDAGTAAEPAGDLLRQAWQAGIASGPARERPIEDIIAEARARRTPQD